MHSKKLLNAAAKYARRGWRVVPVPPRRKSPRLKRWQKLRLTEADVGEYFDVDYNIGLLTGKPSGGLIDVDLDSPEALVLAPAFLPATGRIHGRRSKPRSHWWYRAKPIPPAEKFCDVDGTCLLELRATGQQTIVPPSVHPSGERIRWESKRRSARVSEDKLRSAVRKTAAAAILARHWPTRGSRDEVAMALAGMLLRAGWGVEDVDAFVYSVAEAAGDEEPKKREVARSTQERLDTERTATGRPRLGELLRGHGKRVADRACEWLGIRSRLLVERGAPGTEGEWPAPLSKKALYGLAGDFVRAVSPHTEADPAGILIEFLVAFGNAAGRKAHFKVGSAEHYANLYGVLVGRSAKARKGTGWAEVEKLFESADLVWAGRCLLPGGLASGEGLIWAVRDAVEKKVKPKGASGGDQETTKIVDEGVIDKRLLVIETEFASPLRIIRREGNILSSTIRRAWDNGNLANVSKHSPARATGAHISILGHITAQELLREFTANEGSNGFANRFLWACVQRARMLPLGGSLPEKERRRLVERLQKALASARKTDEARFTRQARELWGRI